MSITPHFYADLLRRRAAMYRALAAQGINRKRYHRTAARLQAAADHKDPQPPDPDDCTCGSGDSAGYPGARTCAYCQAHGQPMPFEEEAQDVHATA